MIYQLHQKRQCIGVILAPHLEKKKEDNRIRSLYVSQIIT
jgi:hypothetical protein